jgi:hypothetical protein
VKTQVEFRSTKFPAYPDEEMQLNPGIWGKRLAEYLADHLASTGIAVEQPLPEDWGWYLPVSIDGVRLALCCGHQDGDADQFVVFTDPATPSIRRGFKKVDVTSQLERLTTRLNDILAGDPEITDVVWVDA